MPILPKLELESAAVRVGVDDVQFEPVAAVVSLSPQQVPRTLRRYLGSKRRRTHPGACLLAQEAWVLAPETLPDAAEACRTARHAQKPGNVGLWTERRASGPARRTLRPANVR